jgi:hypothetical protein
MQFKLCLRSRAFGIGAGIGAIITGRTVRIAIATIIGGNQARPASGREGLVLELCGWARDDSKLQPDGYKPPALTILRRYSIAGGRRKLKARECPI